MGERECVAKTLAKSFDFVIKSGLVTASKSRTRQLDEKNTTVRLVESQLVIQVTYLSYRVVNK